jgi:hypothetical protein
MGTSFLPPAGVTPFPTATLPHVVLRPLQPVIPDVFRSGVPAVFRRDH